MAKSSALTRKEMKGPDRYQVVTGQAMGWLAERQKLVLILLGAVVGAIAIAAIVSAVADKRDKAAGSLLYKAYDALDADISSVPLPGSTRTLFKTEEERTQAVISAAEEVRKQYPNGPAAATAALAIGDAQLQQKKYDEALASYEVFLRDAAKDNSLRFAALEGVAYAYEQKNDLAKAAETYERLAKEVPFYKDRAALERARVLGKAGKVDEAKKILDAFPTDFKDSTLKVQATEQLHRLAGK